jgi:hypothetical protein
MARKRTKKGKKLRFRNIVLLGLLFVAFVGCIVAVNVMKLDVELILPERLAAEDLIRGDRTQNAYCKMAEATSLQPQRPLSLLVDDPDFPGSQMEYEIVEGTIGSVISLRRPDNDEILLQYLKDAEALVQLVNEASDYPYFMYPNYFSDNLYSYNNELIVRPYALLAGQLAYGMAQIEHWNDIEGGLDTLRRHINLQTTYATSTVSNGSWNQNWQIFYPAFLGLYRRADDPDLRASLRKLYESMDQPFPDPQLILEAILGAIDESLMAPSVRTPEQRKPRFDEKLRLIELQLVANSLRERIPKLQALAALQPSEYVDNIILEDWQNLSWLNIQSISTYVLESIYNRLTGIHHINARHIAIPIAFTIEDYHRENDAYPESLERLVPDYIDELPINPVTLTPFEYELNERGYVMQATHDVLSVYDGESYSRTFSYLRYSFPKYPEMID